MTASVLRFGVAFHWRGTLVCHSTCTATMAGDQARNFIRANFAGPRVAHEVNAMHFLSDQIEGLASGTSRQVGYGDETGTAKVTITKL